MINKANGSRYTQQNLPDSKSDTETLCVFKCEGHEYSIIQSDTDQASISDDDLIAGNLLKVIGHFEVNGRKCFIVQNNSALDKTDNVNLSVLLSVRELQIATLVALGCPNKQVADKLHISEWTVATYLRRIFAKLGVYSRAAMTYRCASLISKQDQCPHPNSKN